ncbi:MAG: hypothetical protein M1829_001000 [Trizodia sp. TS-e1964]|nr:MAG: hypothetical protein M1829_001000 [Trizodia sp. TS-e1964]
MRLPSLLGPTAADSTSIFRLPLILLALISSSCALNFDPLPSPNLDLSQLGRVGLAGDFSAISLYQYLQQNENGYNTNGSSSILARTPNGGFATLASSDASIRTMCTFVMQNGMMAGVIVGGNFTSLNGTEAQAIALFDPSTSKVTPLTGVTGKVSALLCDQKTNTVYVGGDFKGANSTNAIAWVGGDGWTNLPFAGFNGPVTSIQKLPNGNIVFGGTFDGLGNTTSPQQRDQQIINLSSATISASLTSSSTGFNDPKNIICKTTGQDGAGNTWLLADGQPGYWSAHFNFGFQPSKLRLWNTQQDGRGTKEFRFTALPDGGIMNLTYTDPATGRNATCDARCPLSATTAFQDFRFVNQVGMGAFRLDISSWYGSGGGLNGIQLFQDDIYVFAINDLNEPTCAGLDFPSTATTTGPWVVRPSQQSGSEFLFASLTPQESANNSVSVVFKPDIRQSGNYTVTVFTPGCIQDVSCISRGRVNITGIMATSSATKPFQTEIFQTNSYDKYDEVYRGFVDANSPSFRPTVSITPSSGQPDGLNLVVQKVRFELNSPAGGLNGLYEYNPNLASVQANFGNSEVIKAGTDLGHGAHITSLAVQDNITYVAGNFTSNNSTNILAIENGKATTLAGGGLNAAVSALFFNSSILYVGGNFTNTATANTPGLNNVAAFSIIDKQWQPLGAGVDGRVHSIVPLAFNVTSNSTEAVISITGSFSQILAFGGSPAFAVDGFAIWIPSRKTWLQNINTPVASINGQLVATVDLPNGTTLYAGSLSSQGLSASGAISLPITGNLQINKLPFQLLQQPSQRTGIRRRALAPRNPAGIVTGLFYNVSNRNITVLGGHFAANATDGSTINNLLFINGSNSDQVTGPSSGLSVDSTFQALKVQDDILYAGGNVTGKINNAPVNGLVLYDLVRASFVATQPPAFSGPNVVVNSISIRPNTGDVYVAGSFDSAGALSCPSLCIFTSSASQWNSPGLGLTGSVSTITWASNDRLVVSGNLTIDGSVTYVATYDANARTWTPYPGANTLPGPVTVLTPATSDASEFWVAGSGTNGSPFLAKRDDSTWVSVGDSLGKDTIIRGLQIMSLSAPHADNALVDPNQILLVTGQLSLPNFGNASAALFDGTSFTPFILSTAAGNLPGSLSQIFTEKQDFFESSERHLATGFVVLAALGAALGLLFLLVLVGFFADRWRRKREGYIAAPAEVYDIKENNIERIPPSDLFGSLGRQGARGGPGGAPMI